MAPRIWDERLLKAYLADGWHVVEKRPGPREHEWAYDAACEITDSDDPEVVLPFVLALVQQTPKELLNYVAAGPLEDLLRKHSAAVVDRVLARAAVDAKLRTALAGVWGLEDMDPGAATKLKGALSRWGRTADPE